MKSFIVSTESDSAVSNHDQKHPGFFGNQKLIKNQTSNIQNSETRQIYDCYCGNIAQDLILARAILKNCSGAIAQEQLLRSACINSKYMRMVKNKSMSLEKFCLKIKRFELI